MRKFNFRNIYFCFLIISLILCGFLYFNKNDNVFAQDENTLLTITQYNGTDKTSGIKIGNGEVAFVLSSQKVCVSFSINNDENLKQNNYSIIQFTYSASLNGKSITSLINEYNIEVTKFTTNEFEMILSFDGANAKTSPYGKYSLAFTSFLEDNNGSQYPYNTTFTFYCVQQSSYYESTHVSSTFENCNQVSAQNLTYQYDRIYLYNYTYTNLLTSSNTNNLPSVSFNKYSIKATIKKTLQKTSQEQVIYFDGNKIVSSQTQNKLVDIIAPTDADYLTLVFNDIGSYSITYDFIYYNGQTVEDIPASTHFTTNKMFENVTRCDLVEIFGYQLFYNDITSSSQKEFKTVQNGKITDGTDFSYLVTNYDESLNIVDEKNPNNLKNVQNERLNILLEKLNGDEDDKITVQRTNQSPVQFNYNVAIYNKSNVTSNHNTYIDSVESKYWKLTKIGESYELASFDEYKNEPFTDTGVYIVNVIYKFIPTIIGSDSTCENSIIKEATFEKLRSQWFIFEITNETIEMEVKTSNDDLSEPLYDGAFTNKEVIINKSKGAGYSKYNAQTKLVVSYQENYTGEYKILESDAEGNYKVSNDGNYIATMYFGKDLRRNYSSTFTIDTQSIEDIQLFEVFKNVNSSSYTYKNEYGSVNTYDFITSKDTVVSWNDKISGSQITAKYKYIPLSKNTSALSSYTLKQFYANSMSIPNEYTFKEDATSNLSEINYNNAKSYLGTNIESSFVLTQSGMYVFELKDSAGNTSYLGFIIDKTPNLVIQELDDVYTVEHSTQNILSSDAKVMWGKYKAIRFADIKFNDGSYNTSDEWLNTVLNTLSDDVRNSYFTAMQINGVASYYIISENEATAFIYINEDKVILNESTNPDFNDYTYQVKFADGENTYEFYFLSKQDSKYLTNFNNSETFFIDNYVATHKLKISSDASRMSLYYGQIEYTTSGDIVNEFLSNSSYRPLPTVNDSGFSKLNNYLSPTSEKMLTSYPIISLMFDATPEEGVIEIESVKYSFTPFTKNTSKYTYIFGETVEKDVLIYDRTSTANLAKLSANGLYVWEVNKEYNYLLNNYNGGYQTAAGKYTITRTYKILTETVDRVNESFDYIERVYTFIVDPYGIITAPELVNGELHSYIGDSIKLQVLEGVNQMFFNDIFLASNNPSEIIMSTNKLPVSVMIPCVKYGYTSTSFVKENSIMYFNSQDSSSEIQSYALTAEIRYKENSASSQTASKIYYSLSSPMTNGYLGFYTDTNGTMQNSFQAVGVYEVYIYQGIGVNRSSFKFCFEIVENAPSFSITTLANDELGQYNNSYYTNQEVVRISWEDPENEYLAIIDVNKIKCNVNGVSTYLNPSEVHTTGVYHYIDLDLKTVNGYFDGSVIEITMQYQGDSKFYNVGSYSSSKVVVIDTVAPDANINKLVALTGIDPILLRNVQTKYNTTTSTGIYSYFAFAVDVSSFNSIIDTTSYANGQAKDIFFRSFEDGTKYNSIYVQETPTSVIENSLASFSSIDILLDNIKSYANRYLEIVELDIAGNITVYTIYLTDIYDDNNILSSVITYKNNDRNAEIKYSTLKATNELFAKSNLTLTNVNFSNYAWNQITISGVTYLKTPYLANGYYNLNTYNPDNPSLSVESIDSFANLNSSSTKYEVLISFVPYFNNITISASVLNSSLSAILTSKTPTYQDQEGILIKIPNSVSSKDATIYAVSVRISRFEKIAGTNQYKEEQIYDFTDETYFSVVNKDITGPSTIGLSYVTYLGATYLKIILTSPISNTYYKYRIIDNFDEVFTDIDIFNSEKIEKELASKVDIQEVYEHGELYLYSTKDIDFRYNESKDKIRLTVVSTYETIIFNLWEASGKEEFIASGYGTLNEPINSVIKILKLNAPAQDMANGIVGGEYRFIIEKFEAFNNIDIMSSPYQKFNLVIYNTIPGFVLYGTLNESENALFNKGTMYGNQINITFKQSTGSIPCEVYLQNVDGTIEKIETGKIVSETGTYYLIVKFTKILTDSQYDIVLNFTISNNESDFYNVVYEKDGQTYYAMPTGNSFTYTASNKTRSIPTHYILSTNDFKIIYNTEQGVAEEKEPEIITTNGYITYIYQLSNVSSISSNVTTYYNRTIAITIIPETTNILSNYSYYTNEGTRSNLSGTLTTFVISKEENYTSNKKLAWQSYYGISENLVTVNITYGEDNAPYTPNIITENNISYIVLSTSGTYFLTFSDVAGNIHLFDGTTSTYTIRYIKSVIYTVNGQSPINNAIYDSEVEISIPKSTTKYYDSNAQPKINVLRNGVEYEVEHDSYNRSFKFTEPGLYKVSFSAAVTNVATKITTEINEEPLYFLIIKSTESRYAFDYSEYSTYYIKQIIKNDVDVTKEYTNSNMGNIIYVSDLNDVTNQKAYLKNVLISVNDAKTGRGNYTITICTNNEFNQEFSFSFWINNPEPPISVSEKENKSTTDKIYVTFNTTDLIENVGDCVLKISGRKDIKLTGELLNNNKLQASYNIELSDARVYDIQLFSESGKLLYTYRVTKVEPLNSVAIILIVVSSVVAVGLVIVFVLLRKRMKVR